jgi:hypothetical protein
LVETLPEPEEEFPVERCGNPFRRIIPGNKMVGTLPDEEILKFPGKRVGTLRKKKFQVKGIATLTEEEIPGKRDCNSHRRRNSR